MLGQCLATTERIEGIVVALRADRAQRVAAIQVLQPVLVLCLRHAALEGPLQASRVVACQSREALMLIIMPFATACKEV